MKPFGTDDFALNPEPRCPCLLLLDVSGSMAGEPITELNEGLKAFRDELVADPLASKRVEVACITFGPVHVATEFETASVFQPPWLRATGETPMGAAIKSGVELVRLRKETYRSNGIAFYRPWIFLNMRFRGLFQWLSNSMKSISRSTPGDEVPLKNPTEGPDGWASI
jgi:uncharacterized protein YegL